MSFCPKCGTEHPDENAYCERCGWQFGAPVAAPAPAPEAVKRGRDLAAVFVALGIVSLAFFGNTIIAAAVFGFIALMQFSKTRRIVTWPQLAIIGIVLCAVGVFRFYHPWDATLLDLYLGWSD